MLVLSRREEGRVKLILPRGAGEIEVVVCRIDGHKVRLGFDAPDDVVIVRDDAKKGMDNDAKGLQSRKHATRP